MKHSTRPQSQVSWLLILLIMGIVMGNAPANAGPVAQDDPVAQCAEGVQLFHDFQDAAAAPLLETGFAGRGEGRETPVGCNQAKERSL